MHQRSSVGNGRSLPTSKTSQVSDQALYHLGQGWGTSGTRAINGTRHNILGTPAIKMVCILFQNNKVHYEISRRNASDRSGVDVSTHVYHRFALVTSWTTVGYDAKFIHA
ncbi:hypothetical protein TNCV_875731 [Trichonephila clavipes]|nr:hypothetical protein TNCV_875731 [Trichonephila clavipes]